MSESNRFLMRDIAMMRRMFLGLTIGGTLLMAAGDRAARADDTVALKPPQVGDVAPEFSATGLSGQEFKLAAVREQGPVILVFLRGYPGYQCPLCTQQVAQLMAAAKAFDTHKARTILVYPGPADHLTDRASEFLKGDALPEAFTLVVDPDYALVNAYGVRWDAPQETAYPSTFIIDRDGVIRWSKISKEHGDRGEPKELLAALKALD
jgi:peroxiredoxin